MDNEKIIRQILPQLSFDKIISGVPVDLSKTQDAGLVLTAALHCILNGPVSVHKNTNFPTIDQPTSIDKLIGLRTSNNSWKSLCLMIASQLPKEPKLKCSSVDKNKDYWPLADWVKR